VEWKLSSQDQKDPTGHLHGNCLPTSVIGRPEHRIITHQVDTGTLSTLTYNGNSVSTPDSVGAVACNERWESIPLNPAEPPNMNHALLVDRQCTEQGKGNRYYGNQATCCKSAKCEDSETGYSRLAVVVW
jgi:hypothetical protein